MDFALNGSQRDDVDFGDFDYDQAQNYVEVGQERDSSINLDRDDSGLSFDEKLQIVQGKLEKCQTAVTVFMRVIKGAPPEQIKQKMTVLRQQQQLFDQVLDLHRLLTEPLRGDDEDTSVRQKEPAEYMAYRIVQAGKLPSDPAFEENRTSFRFVRQDRRQHEYLIVYQAWQKVKTKAFDNCLYRAHDNQLLVDIDNDEEVREELWQLKQSSLMYHQQEQELERREAEEAERREQQEKARLEQLLQQEDEFIRQQRMEEELKQSEQAQGNGNWLFKSANNMLGSVFNKKQQQEQVQIEQDEALQQQAHDDLHMRIMEQRKEDIKNVAGLMKDMRELSEDQAREVLEQQKKVEVVDENQNDTLDKTADAGEQIKQAYVTSAKSGRNRLMAGLAVVGGVVGTVVTGGIGGGVVLAVAGGLGGRAAGNKVVEKAKRRAENCQFERTDQEYSPDEKK